MAEVRRAASRRQRRRELGQNFLTDRSVVERFLDRIQICPGDLVVDLGAGAGALTIALLERGARIVAVEIDESAIADLRRRCARLPDDAKHQLRIVHSPIERFRFPREPYRVVANPPFGHSTAVLRRLLDDPTKGPYRADLVLQREVVRKRAASPPTSLASAAWAPWWTFEHGMVIDRRAFAPPPSVDAAVLHIERRELPVLPVWLAPGFAEVLRARWESGSPR
ncbi:MAG: rRNA adenine N(6)-methyltransferase family protein [Ilumatobacteraceae bacterium]